MSPRAAPAFRADDCFCYFPRSDHENWFEHASTKPFVHRLLVAEAHQRELHPRGIHIGEEIEMSEGTVMAHADSPSLFSCFYRYCFERRPPGLGFLCSSFASGSHCIEEACATPSLKSDVHSNLLVLQATLSTTKKKNWKSGQATHPQFYRELFKGVREGGKLGVEGVWSLSY